jgi:hypothetical protein
MDSIVLLIKGEAAETPLESRLAEKRLLLFKPVIGKTPLRSRFIPLAAQINVKRRFILL